MTDPGTGETVEQRTPEREDCDECHGSGVVTTVHRGEEESEYCGCPQGKYYVALRHQREVDAAHWYALREDAARSYERAVAAKDAGIADLCARLTLTWVRL